MDYTSLPEELRTLPRWVNWRGIPGEGRINKPPVDPATGAICNIVTDPQTWQPFEQALKHTGEEHVDGVGLVMVEDGFPPLIGIDIDHCLNKETGEIDPEARAYIDVLDSYTEISPSGEGLRVFVYGVKPGPKCKRGNYEMYSRDRYLTVTGNHWPGSPKTLEYRQEAVNKLYREKIEKLNGNPSCDNHKGDTEKPGFPGTDEELLARMRQSSSTDDLMRGLRPKFVRLYDDADMTGYPSASEAELACLQILAFWCGPDPERIERLVRESEGLAMIRAGSDQPDKWERKDYLPGTIKKAISNCKGGFYDPDYQAAQAAADALPTIQVRQGDLVRVVDRAEAALAAHHRLYSRDGVLVQVVYRPPGTAYQRERNPHARTLQLDPVTRPDGMLLPLAEVAHWSKFDGRSEQWKAVNPPLDVAKAVINRGQYKHLPIISGITRLPVMRKDGSIVDQPGYDPKTGIFFDPGAQQFLPVKANPTAADVKQALHVLQQPLADFPFVSEVDKAVALAMLLETTQRLTLPSAPFYCCDATRPGTGKTLLAQIMATMLTGSAVPPLSYIGEKNEQRKQLFAALIEGAPLILLDNVNEVIRSDNLCRITTGEGIKDRILGVSKTAAAASPVSIVATGNGLSVAGDLSRRSLRCTQDAGMEHPESRKGFLLNLAHWVPAHRAELARAALTLVRAYVVARLPDQGIETWGSFEAWSQRIRAPMVWAGLPDPHRSNRELKVEDEEGMQLDAILSCWEAVFDKPVTIKSISETLKSTRGGYGCDDGEEERAKKAGVLLDVLEEYFPPKRHGDLFDRQSFGAYLRGKESRIQGGRMVVKQGQDLRTKSVKWTVKEAGR